VVWDGKRGNIRGATSALGKKGVGVQSGNYRGWLGLNSLEEKEVSETNTKSVKIRGKNRTEGE